MPAFSRAAVGTASLLLTTHAHVDPPEWILGEATKPCTEVCQAKSKHCIGGYWPTDIRSLLNVSLQAAGSGGPSLCVEAEMSETHKFAPALMDSNGMCIYRDNEAEIKCGANTQSLTNARRYCPCSKSAPQFMLAGAGESCEDFCSARHGICSSDASLWPDSVDKMKELAKPLGQFCRTAQQLTNGDKVFHAPSIKGDLCYFPAASLTSCSAKLPEYRRFCPCLGARLYEAPAPQTTNNNGRSGTFGGHQGHGGCRYGGFKIGEGTGGEKKLVPQPMPQNNDECRLRVASFCPEANGATFSHRTGDCWCEIGMTGYMHTDGNSVCWFTDGTLTAGSGSLIGRFSISKGLVAGASNSALAGSVLAVASSALAVLGLVRWRIRREEAMEGEASALTQLEAAD